MDGTKNFTFNWGSTLYKDGLNLIIYYYDIASWVDRFKEYQIPATQVHTYVERRKQSKDYETNHRRGLQIRAFGVEWACCRKDYL